MYKQSKPLKHPQNSEHGFNYAIFLLNLSAQTEGEITRKMLRRGYVSHVIEEVVDRLKEYDYINDEKYIENFVNSMKSYRTYGYFAIKQKLLLKHLPINFIETRLNSYLSIKEERFIAQRYLTKELKSFVGSVEESKAFEVMSKLPFEEKQKLMRKLASRGFRMDSILS